MGQALVIKPFSAYECYYNADLTRLPSDLEEDAIYDYFVDLGLTPIIAPALFVVSLVPRNRTVWFPQQNVPDALVTGGQPIREIFFPGFENPVYVRHKRHAFNKVVPQRICWA